MQELSAFNYSTESDLQWWLQQVPCGIEFKFTELHKICGSPKMGVFQHALNVGHQGTKAVVVCLEGPCNW